ncbi:TPA: GGDEF domain-containing protein, partial [Cronobacter sakazakii]|nr:GGDEF domain-containing protein [Cronobacter sakazakii]
DAFSVLIRGADTALYLAKNHGRNQAYRFSNTIATGNDKSIYAA